MAGTKTQIVLSSALPMAVNFLIMSKNNRFLEFKATPATARDAIRGDNNNNFVNCPVILTDSAAPT